MKKHIYLVGFMGSGKSTVGKLLAAQLARPFLDLDRLIELHVGKPISTIFQEDGEDCFRNVESALLRDTEDPEPFVMSLGGGAFQRPENRAVVRARGVSVWLRVSLEEAIGRCGDDTSRPLAGDPERFAALFAERQQNYRATDIQIDATGRTPEAICTEILSHLKRGASASWKGGPVDES